MNAHGGHVKGREGLEARSLGQDPPELDVVLLAAALLSRALRVAVVDPAAPGVGKAAPLDGLEVAELDTAVGQDGPEEPRELERPQDGLHPVEVPDDGFAGVLLEQSHDLEPLPGKCRVRMHLKSPLLPITVSICIAFARVAAGRSRKSE